MGQKVLVMKDLSPIMELSGSPFISTVALARCRGALGTAKLFQQFPATVEKPLKRLAGAQAQAHRAKATVSIGGAFGAHERDLC